MARPHEINTIGPTSQHYGPPKSTTAHEEHVSDARYSKERQQSHKQALPGMGASVTRLPGLQETSTRQILDWGTAWARIYHLGHAGPAVKILVQKYAP